MTAAIRKEASLSDVQEQFASLSISKSKPSSTKGKTSTGAHRPLKTQRDFDREIDEVIALKMKKAKLEQEIAEEDRKIALADQKIADARQGQAAARQGQAEARQMQAEARQMQAEARKGQAEGRQMQIEAHEKLSVMIEKARTHLLTKKGNIQKIFTNPQDTTRLDILQRLDGLLNEIQPIKQQHDRHESIAKSMVQFDMRSKPLLQQIALIEKNALLR